MGRLMPFALGLSHSHENEEVVPSPLRNKHASVFRGGVVPDVRIGTVRLTKGLLYRPRDAARWIPLGREFHHE